MGNGQLGELMVDPLASVRRKMDLGLVFLAFPSEITLEVLALPR
jgi:hypothetical protein